MVVMVMLFMAVTSSGVLWVHVRPFTDLSCGLLDAWRSSGCLVLPAAALALMGKAGAVVVMIMLFMAVTSSGAYSQKSRPCTAGQLLKLTSETQAPHACALWPLAMSLQLAICDVADSTPIKLMSPGCQALLASAGPCKATRMLALPLLDAGGHVR